MSLATARVPASARDHLFPRLRLLVSPPTPRWRPPFVAACITVLVGSLLALLLLNIGLARGAYTENQLSLQQTALMEKEQALAEQVSRDSSPQLLAERARNLGMIPNTTPAFIQLSDGTILGDPTAAVAPSDGGPASLTDPAVPVGPVVPPGVDPSAPPADVAPAPAPADPGAVAGPATGQVTGDGAVIDPAAVDPAAVDPATGAPAGQPTPQPAAAGDGARPAGAAR